MICKSNDRVTFKPLQFLRDSMV